MRAIDVVVAHRAVMRVHQALRDITRIACSDGGVEHMERLRRAPERREVRIDRRVPGRDAAHHIAATARMRRTVLVARLEHQRRQRNQ